MDFKTLHDVGLNAICQLLNGIKKKVDRILGLCLEWMHLVVSLKT